MSARSSASGSSTRTVGEAVLASVTGAVTITVPAMDMANSPSAVSEPRNVDARTARQA